jgi:uncharacterized RDD family membrane protein YckC
MLDPIRQEPGDPEGLKPPFRNWLPAILIMVLSWILFFIAFTAIIVIAEPTKSNLLAGLALFVLISGTGISASLCFWVKHRLDQAYLRKALAKEQGDVHFIS